jgi:two-component system OmpR family response regulator/two-component system alkaline phosphatase synthesis response regulator PhoP
LHPAQRLPDIRRALIAESDRATRLLVARHLISEGFDIGECGDGLEALEQLTTQRFDLIVLDGALAGLDGIALCRAIRQGRTNPDSAIFIVAASTAEADKVLALVNGADDYLTKPLSIREFLARVAAVMRRAAYRCERTVRNAIESADFKLDPAKRQVWVRGRAIACSKQEFELLYALASSPGIVFSREQLLARSWSPPAAPPRSAIRLVDPIISRLRRKIEREPDTPRLIITVWGVGYKFAE